MGLGRLDRSVDSDPGHHLRVLKLRRACTSAVVRPRQWTRATDDLALGAPCMRCRGIPSYLAETSRHELAVRPVWLVQHCGLTG